MTQQASNQTIEHTALHALHCALGARMTAFAGYDMPVQYPTGILTEHLHTRGAAGLFDVSHMGQVRLTGSDPAAALERLVPGDIVSLQPGHMRYTQFTDENGGILDDLMVTRISDGELFLVVNAGCKAADIAHLRTNLTDCRIDYLSDRALIALQGPEAVTVLARIAPEAARLAFMTGTAMPILGQDCFVTRSGYTGEDGFEISVPAAAAEAFARHLLQQAEVKPVGLGARDSLRLEAGLCLYGHDIDTTTTPIEAGLAWSISKRRRDMADFPGAKILLQQLANGAPRRLVGIRPDGRAPARDDTPVLDPANGRTIGRITSGSFGPSVGGPVAMGYVETAFAKPGTALHLLVRGKPVQAETVKLPFIPKRYAK